MKKFWSAVKMVAAFLALLLLYLRHRGAPSDEKVKEAETKIDEAKETVKAQGKKVDAAKEDLEQTVVKQKETDDEIRARQATRKAKAASFFDNK